MTYLLLDLVFLVPVVAVALVAVVTRRSPRWAALGGAASALLVSTVVFDNVIVGLGIVAYDPDRILGVRMPIAPVEDLSYAIAAVVLLPSLWALLPSASAAGSRERPPISPGARDKGRRP